MYTLLGPVDALSSRMSRDEVVTQSEVMSTMAPCNGIPTDYDAACSQVDKRCKMMDDNALQAPRSRRGARPSGATYTETLTATPRLEKLHRLTDSHCDICITTIDTSGAGSQH